MMLRYQVPSAFASSGHGFMSRAAAIHASIPSVIARVAACTARTGPRVAAAGRARSIHHRHPTARIAAKRAGERTVGGRAVDGTVVAGTVVAGTVVAGTVGAVGWVTCCPADSGTSTAVIADLQCTPAHRGTHDSRQ